MSELVIGGVLIVPVIVALIEMAKQLGMPSRYARWLNAALSVLAYGLVQWSVQSPDVVPVLTMIMTALVIFLSAAGFYDTVAQPLVSKFRVQK